MEHAKKLVIVDPRFPKQNMRERTLTALDAEMETILNSEESDDVKAKNYLAALHRHKSYSEIRAPNENMIEKFVPEVMRSVPTNQKYKAKRLMKRLSRQKEVELSKDGELIYRQRKIPRSDIVELIGDVLDAKARTKSPVGWEALSAALKTVETPQELVNNPRRWHFMQGTSKTKAAALKRRAWIHY